MAATAGVGTSVPAFLIMRPAMPANGIERQHVSERLTDLVARFRVSVLIAPAGFGKTTAISAWAADLDWPVAWLTLTDSDRQPRQLRRSLRSALRSDHAGPGPAVLVIDDIHLLDTAAARAELNPLLEHGPEQLRIVLVGRQEPRLGLTRVSTGQGLGRMGAEDLAFSADEIVIAGRALGRELSVTEAARVHALTDGWPVAVRLALLSGSGWATPGPRGAGLDDRTAIPQLVDYLVESVIDVLPDHLRSFAVRVCTCDWLTGRLAIVLSDDPQGPQMLEQLLALGLPLERLGLLHDEPVYHWHPVMAQAGRAILLRNAPVLAAELHVRVARELAAVNPPLAVSHALRGRDPALAAELIRSQWLAAALRGDSQLLDELCEKLPAPWSEDPEILAIRAACRRNTGDGQASALFSQRARLASLAGGRERRQRFELTELLARLFLIDGDAELGEVADQASERLATPGDLTGPVRAGALLLIGWTVLRLRRPGSAAELLSEAVAACRAENLDDLADRARAHLSFALAFLGDFPGARAQIALVAAGDEAAGWRRTDGSAEDLSEGWICFWLGDPAAAAASLTRAIQLSGDQTSYGQLARVLLVHAHLAAGDAAGVAEAPTLLDGVADDFVQGVPWRLYKAVTQAGVLLFNHDPKGAVALLDEMLPGASFAPVISAFAAEFYWRCGRPVEARREAARLAAGVPAFLQASGLVVTALCERLDGAVENAHALLEEALAIGVATGARHAFGCRDPQLAELLREHAERGTAHETFLAEQLAAVNDRSSSSGPSPLSSREREILAYLETALPSSEICQNLYISQNTLKSHLRSIYRKLGVDNRRDAVRVARRRQLR